MHDDFFAPFSLAIGAFRPLRLSKGKESANCQAVHLRATANRTINKKGVFPTVSKATFVLLLLTALSACATLPAGLIEIPKVTLTDLRPGQMGLLAQEFKVQLLIQNTNPVPLPLTGMSYAISLNGHEFATGVSNKTQIIPALGEQRLDVTITSSVMSLVQQIRSLTQSQDKTFSYKLDGKFHVTDKFTPLAFSTQDKIKLDNF